MPDISVELQPLLFNAIVRVLGAIATLLIGRWLAGVARRAIRRGLARAHATPSISEILERTTFYVVLLIAVFVALVTLGIPAEVLITAIGVVAIVAAVALRESLRDLAATVIFVIFRPFKVGDRIETNGVVGDVQEILMFSTVLITLDNRQLTIPNGNIQNTNLVNYSALETIRLDLPVTISYADDLNKARATLLELAGADARVLREPAPVVDTMELGESGVGLVLRVHTTPTDYWPLRPALNEKIKLEFDRRGLTFPFPQLDLHVDRGQGTGTTTLPVPASGQAAPKSYET
jgi:small conductance mechanosensitive channel